MNEILTQSTLVQQVVDTVKSVVGSVPAARQEYLQAIAGIRSGQRVLADCEADTCMPQPEMSS